MSPSFKTAILDDKIWHDFVGSEWTDVSIDTIMGEIMDTARTSPRNIIGRICYKCNGHHIIQTPALFPKYEYCQQ